VGHTQRRSLPQSGLKGAYAESTRRENDCMRRVLQIAIVISIGVVLAASAGFLWRFVGYSLSEAFNPLFPHPEEIEAKRQSYLWGIYFLVAVSLSCVCFKRTVETIGGNSFGNHCPTTRMSMREHDHPRCAV